MIILIYAKKMWRILFSGDNYSKEWIEEAERRGLKNNRTYLVSNFGKNSEKL